MVFIWNASFIFPTILVTLLSLGNHLNVSQQASSCMSTTYHTRNLSDMVPHHTYCGNFAVGYASYSQQWKRLGTKEPQETSMQQWTHSEEEPEFGLNSEIKPIFKHKSYGLECPLGHRQYVISSHPSSTMEILGFPQEWLAQFLRLGYRVGVYSRVWETSQLPLYHMW